MTGGSVRHPLTTGLILSLIAWAMPSLAMSPSTTEVTMSQVELADLESLGTFTVTLSGTDIPAYPDDTPCLYAEAVYGERHGETWASWTQIGAAGEALVVHTPKGDLTTSPHQLRLYLRPDVSRTYTPQQAAEAPEAVRDVLSAGTTPLDLVTYTLHKGRTYHARIDQEVYYLPPTPKSPKPTRRINRVLTLSDMPFVDGKPQLTATPRSQSVVY